MILYLYTFSYNMQHINSASFGVVFTCKMFHEIFWKITLCIFYHPHATNLEIQLEWSVALKYCWNFGNYTYCDVDVNMDTLIFALLPSGSHVKWVFFLGRFHKIYYLIIVNFFFTTFWYCKINLSDVILKFVIVNSIKIFMILWLLRVLIYF